jgi:hypothetical protein
MEVLQPDDTQPAEPPLFQSFSQPEIRPPVRMPHLGHVAMLAVFLIFGLVCASILIFTALHFHVFGVSNQQEAATEIRLSGARGCLPACSGMGPMHFACGRGFLLLQLFAVLLP